MKCLAGGGVIDGGLADGVPGMNHEQHRTTLAVGS